MKILLTAIFKDDTEIEMAERMLASFMPQVDGLCVAITGTGEHKLLEKLLQQHKAVYVVTTPETHPEIYHEGKFANFAAARNVSFDLADQQEGYDWYLWADVDDILTTDKELRAVAEEALRMKMDTVFFTYWYSVALDENSEFNETSVIIEHLRERLLKAKVFKWTSRLHEVAVPKDGNYKPSHTMYEFDRKKNQTLAWVHLTTVDRQLDTSERNETILKLQIQDEKSKDPRTLFYLAKTLFDMNKKEKHEEIHTLIDQYLLMSGWPEERANALEYKGDTYSKDEKFEDAINAYLRGVEQFPNHIGLVLKISKTYSQMGEHDKAKHWLGVALRMDAPKTRTTIGNPASIKYLAAILKYNECIREQKLKDAIYWLKVKNSIVKADDDGMIKTLEEAVTMNDMAINVFNYAKWLKMIGHPEKIRPLLEALPPELGREPFAAHIANEINEPKTWPDKSIVYCASWGAEHFEGWSPKNMETGIGGSETAIIELSKRWAKAGYDVTVYGDPRDDAGDYGGVHYRPYYEINWKDTFDTIIIWRLPQLLDQDIKAKRIFYDAHDVESQVNWTEERMAKVAKAFFKSNYHRSMVPKMSDSKAVVVSNGIDLYNVFDYGHPKNEALLSSLKTP